MNGSRSLSSSDLSKRQRVVELELEAGAAAPPELGGDAVETGPRGALDDGRACQPRSPPAKAVTRGPRRAEYRVVGVDEAGQVVGPRMGVAEARPASPSPSSRS